MPLLKAPRGMAFLFLLLTSLLSIVYQANAYDDCPKLNLKTTNPGKRITVSPGKAVTLSVKLGSSNKYFSKDVAFQLSYPDGVTLVHSSLSPLSVKKNAYVDEIAANTWEWSDLLVSKGKTVTLKLKVSFGS